MQLQPTELAIWSSLTASTKIDGTNVHTESTSLSTGKTLLTIDAMNTRNIIGGILFVLGLTAAVTIEGSFLITLAAIAMMVTGATVADIWYKEGRQ